MELPIASCDLLEPKPLALCHQQCLVEQSLLRIIGQQVRGLQPRGPGCSSGASEASVYGPVVLTFLHTEITWRAL